MINISTGEIKLDDYELIIHPDLTYEQFIAGNFRDVQPCEPDQMGYVRPSVHGLLDGNKVSLGLYFRFGKIQSLHLYFAATENLIFTVAERWLAGWLTRTIGRPPPYEGDWGRMEVSNDVKGGSTSIDVIYKDGIANLGFKDMASFHEYCNYPDLRPQRERR